MPPDPKALELIYVAPSDPSLRLDVMAACTAGGAVADFSA